MSRPKRERPETLSTYFTRWPAWQWPVMAVEWPFEWMAYALSHWSFIEVLEYVGKFSVLVAVVFYFHESGNRLKQKHYQAWQVINTAQGMGGSGGRIEALAELNADGVPLVGVDVSSAFLQGLQLPKARLLRANFDSADVRNSSFAGADLSYASLRAANFRSADLSRTNFDSADFSDADLCRADLSGADLANLTLDRADLGNADLSGIQWSSIRSLKKANIAGIRNPPSGFVAWALKNGAVQLPDNPSCPASPPAR